LSADSARARASWVIVDRDWIGKLERAIVELKL